MPLRLEDKQQVVSEVAAVAQTAHSLVAADYCGLTVAEMTELRSQARDADVYLRVVKNTLARRALEGTEFQCVQDRLTGPLILAFSREEPGAAARLLKRYMKDHAKLEVKMLAIGGQVMEPSDLERLASIPTREEALATLMAAIRAPLDKFARTLNEVPGKFVRTLAAIRDHKEQS